MLLHIVTYIKFNQFLDLKRYNVIYFTGNKCEVESFTSTEIVCASPAKDDKTLSPGNR